jgi:Domain of unknown function (DUF1844)
MSEPGASPNEEPVSAASNETPDAGAHSEHSDYPLPPASFEFFVLSMKTQAEMALGLIHFGEEKDRPKPDLRVARHSIDLLGMICEKTKGNLSIEEQRLIENSLTELRFRYVQVLESSRKQQQ